ncbi:caffeine-induced death protein cid2 [Ophiostoma piceae UAMH 11346]|uniref:Caffeine-induced death protein cid2 n=1 Tax=Ophiostoma piceae (strain UAMH 11346) TaxID=1262450 RepID=S3CV01_OPHP1|nr:caffeine-induced death protein cid2 [Ophiostoma piceae UAMH 11346]
MAAQPSQPALTPQFCFSTVFLRDFLRASRAVDDTITQHLNALVTPSRAGFDPSSTANRSPSSSYSYSSSAHSAAPAPACQAFRDAVLFPSWQARDDVIRYCSGVAEAAVAQDIKDKVAAELADEAAAAAAAAGSLDVKRGNSKHGEPVTEREDPYINRRQYALVEPQANLLASLMRQEQGVETIVRARSWDVLQGRCGGSAVVGAASGEPGWEAALAQWRARQGR